MQGGADGTGARHGGPRTTGGRVRTADPGASILGDGRRRVRWTRWLVVVCLSVVAGDPQLDHIPSSGSGVLPDVAACRHDSDRQVRAHEAGRPATAVGWCVHRRPEVALKVVSSAVCPRHHTEAPQRPDQLPRPVRGPVRRQSVAAAAHPVRPSRMAAAYGDVGAEAMRVPVPPSRSSAGARGGAGGCRIGSGRFQECLRTVTG